MKRRITAGPCKFDLVLSLFEGKPIEFTLEGGETVTVIVQQIAALNREQECWDITGILGKKGSTFIATHYTKRGVGQGMRRASQLEIL